MAAADRGSAKGQQRHDVFCVLQCRRSTGSWAERVAVPTHHTQKDSDDTRHEQTDRQPVRELRQAPRSLRVKPAFPLKSSAGIQGRLKVVRLGLLGGQTIPTANLRPSKRVDIGLRRREDSRRFSKLVQNIG